MDTFILRYFSALQSTPTDLADDILLSVLVSSLSNVRNKGTENPYPKSSCPFQLDEPKPTLRKRLAY